MAHLFEIEAVKQYATHENAIKAFEQKFGEVDVRYFIYQLPNGKFTPVALGERAMQLMVHFHFPVVG